MAVATFWFQWNQTKQERIDRRAELNALQKAERDRIAAQARRIVPEITRSAFFGEDVWLGNIQNNSTGAITGLRVAVSAVDEEGKPVSDGYRKATGELDISQALESIISQTLRGSLGGAFAGHPMTAMLGQQLPRDALVQRIAPEVSAKLRVAMMGQIQADWPSSLGPGQSTSVAYRATRPGLQLHIGVRFEDEAGFEWNRFNQYQPTLVAAKPETTV
ncbi:hypothetical protein MJO55_23620 [Mycolicibacterium rufum]|uniref:Uncharacterized protein n=1 Tax=Mycolicibacterium rufum TaxID=318424 RepID=A0ABY3U980_9MYCO|nr:hypothetical protein [Mycolicibacterium rufum]KGI69922.1 hypothetical protein EU78_23545 [Mycolicibacterium rufum]ULP36175.1 hypothetical protein MJO55_23620 [Mycolicibacterium rufum]